MFNGLRSKITTGNFRGNVLMDMIEEYLDGQLTPYTPHHDIGYDNLDLFINGILGFRKLPAESRNREPEMVYYQKTPVRIILEIIKRAAINPQDVFVDLGSGLGQVVILVHMLTNAKAKGVEFEPAYCDYGRSCAAELNVNGVEFINSDTRDADYSTGSVFYMYTPFEGKILQDTLERLHTEAKNRKIKLITYGSCTQVVAEQTWLFSRYKVYNGPASFGTFVSA
jgi:SAM-dependent methyltransferase